MKLLHLNISGYKLLDDTFSLDFTPKGNKSLEDKEFELSEIDKELYTYNTIGIIGKNASGKTTTVEALAIIYDILSNFKIKNSLTNLKYNKNDINIEIFFYHENNLYFYKTKLIYHEYYDYVMFKDEEIYKSSYYKSYSNDLFNLKKYEKLVIEKFLPDDTSILFLILNKIKIRGSYYYSNLEMVNTIDSIIEMYNIYDNSSSLLNSIIELLDEHIKSIKMENKNKFIISYKNGKKEEKTKNELFLMLSSGTIKGLYLYIQIIGSLITGADFMIDEIEIHFHKTLVENLINLYKDKKINKHGSTLIFTTHYPELLDLFNRTDNIYICKYSNTISLDNMYNYKLRSDAIKSKKFYENTFNTAINYETLMNLKKELLK